MEAENPSALANINNEFKSLQDYSSALTVKESDYSFVECATLADDIRMKGGQWQEGWHFVDNPFIDDGSSISDYPDFKFSSQNITLVIPELVNWLSNTGDYQDSYTYKTVMTHSKKDEAIGRSYAARLLIHFIGDVH